MAAWLIGTTPLKVQKAGTRKCAMAGAYEHVLGAGPTRQCCNFRHSYITYQVLWRCRVCSVHHHICVLLWWGLVLTVNKVRLSQSGEAWEWVNGGSCHVWLFWVSWFVCLPTATGTKTMPVLSTVETQLSLHKHNIAKAAPETQEWQETGS